MQGKEAEPMMRTTRSMRSLYPKDLKVVIHPFQAWEGSQYGNLLPYLWDLRFCMSYACCKFNVGHKTPGPPPPALAILNFAVSDFCYWLQVCWEDRNAVLILASCINFLWGRERQIATGQKICEAQVPLKVAFMQANLRKRSPQRLLVICGPSCRIHKMIWPKV